LAALRRVKGLPGGVLPRHLQKGQQRWQGGPKGRIEREQPRSEFLAYPPYVVTVVELKVGLEQVGDRQIRSGLAVGGRAALQHEPPLGARGLGELMEEAGLAHPSVPDHRHHLPLPGASLAQGLVQGPEFRLPPHERGQLSCGQGLQARPSRAGAHQLVDLYGHGHPLDGHWP
jgi:hypothetical protein